LSRTIVVGRILERWAGKLGESEIWQHVSSRSGVHDSTAGRERDSRHHCQDFVSGRMQSQDNETLAAASPLPQVLDEEERIENVQTMRGSVQGEDVRVLKQPAGEGQSSSLGGCQSVHQAVLGRLQAELLQDSFGLERRGVASASQQHVEAESLLSRQPGTQTTLRG